MQTPRRRYFWILPAFLLALVILACACGSGNSITVKKSDYGTRWPLTVSEAVLTCEGPWAVFAKVDGNYYGVNGMGKTWVEKEYPQKARNIKHIWREDSRMIGEFREALKAQGESLPREGLPADMGTPHMNMMPLINDGLKLCD